MQPSIDIISSFKYWKAVVTSKHTGMIRFFDRDFIKTDIAS
jgi:hypothetical protein